MKQDSALARLDTKKASKVLAWLVPILAVFPTGVWVAVDKSVWPWDQAWYAQGSVELFYTLVRSPSHWAPMMLGPRQKAPGIVWIGELFVPFGHLVRSIDVALLVSILITQALVLILMYRSILQLSRGKTLVAIAGCMMMASAPLFVGLSHQYLVEPMQTLAVAWFVLIMAFSPGWSRARIVGHLLVATPFAMLAKVTSPVYCLGPGLLALVYAFRARQPADTNSSHQKGVTAFIAFGIFLTLAAAAWYYENTEYVIRHALMSFSGPMAGSGGEGDTYLNRIIYWLGATRTSFFVPQVLIVVALILVGGYIAHLSTRDRTTKHFTLCAVVALLQIVGAYAAFSLSPNPDTRFLLPLLPYFALLACWAMAQVERRLVSTLVIAVFTVQFALVHAQALGITQPNPAISHWVYSPDSDTKNATILNSIVSRTCTEATADRYNVVGVELPWLNHHSVSYFAAKGLALRGTPCYYRPLGYAESDPERAWSQVVSLNALYYITVDPDLYPVPADAHNQVTYPVLERVRSSGLFEQEPPLPDSPEILVFRAIEVDPSLSVRFVPVDAYADL